MAVAAARHPGLPQQDGVVWRLWWRDGLVRDGERFQQGLRFVVDEVEQGCDGDGLFNVCGFRDFIHHIIVGIVDNLICHRKDGLPCSCARRGWRYPTFGSLLRWVSADGPHRRRQELGRPTACPEGNKGTKSARNSPNDLLHSSNLNHAALTEWRLAKSSRAW